MGDWSLEFNPSTTGGVKFPWRKILFVLIIALLLTGIASGIAFYLIRKQTPKSSSKPTGAISKTCDNTRYPDICVKSLVDFPGAVNAKESDLVHMSINMTLQRFTRALSLSAKLINHDMDSYTRAAYTDCIELLQGSADHLSRSLASATALSDVNNVKSKQTDSVHDVLTWLSATLTNQNTCDEGFREVKGSLKDKMEDKLHNLWELASNCLNIYSVAMEDDNSVDRETTQPSRRALRQLPSEEAKLVGSGMRDMDTKKDPHFPVWMNRQDRRLMELSATAINADIVVAKDGSGEYYTITEAIKAAPEKSNRRIIIYIKAGTYEEDYLYVGDKKTNVMIIGDGAGKTIITGHRSKIVDKTSTMRTASFGASGDHFIARDITFENYAGPSNHQAVALLVNSDHAVVYRCDILGYQDTLYVHAQRQFYRECNIYGTVDFIFGNAAVVLQNCTIYARKPMAGQKNTITAQNRNDGTQNTGISIHACKILAASDLEESESRNPTFLGRPWQMYSRTVVMLSYMGDHIDPKGWLEWKDTFALDTLFYGEFWNYGPGSNVTDRVKWPGFRVMKSAAEASPFTVENLILGSSWLPASGVPFLGGLTN